MIQTWIASPLPKIIIALLLIGAAIGGGIYLKKVYQKRSRWKREHNSQLKNQVLNQSIKNNHKKEAAEPLKPQSQGTVRYLGKIMLHLLVTRQSGLEEYILNPEEHILVGTRPDCAIVFGEKSVSDYQCEFFIYQDHVYVKNLSPADDTRLQRKNKSTTVDVVGIQICTGDKIIMGQYSMQANLLDSSGKPILN